VTKNDAKPAGTARASAPKDRDSTAPANRRRAASTSKAKEQEPRRKPYGRDEVVQSIIDATLSLWTAKGPAELSMRSIAARAGVNYGLVHRHFGTKDAVIRAAMERVVARSLDHVTGSEDLEAAIDRILPLSTGAHARLLAWATLQYVLDDVLPENDVFLAKMRELAVAGERDGDGGADGGGDEDGDIDVPPEVAVRVGSLISVLYGWRLFDTYLRRGLKLEGLDQAELDGYIREDMLRLLRD
jgi:AcrR family transcriptional regulator